MSLSDLSDAALTYIVTYGPFALGLICYSLRLAYRFQARLRC